jgi:hypothetical protein
MIETPYDPLAPVECNEFDCAGCGRHIVSFPPMDPLPMLCGACEWMNEFVPDPNRAREDAPQAYRRRSWMRKPKPRWNCLAC